MEEKKQIIFTGIVIGFILLFITLASYYYENNYINPYRKIVYSCSNGETYSFSVHIDNLTNYTLADGERLCNKNHIIENVENIRAIS